MVDTEQFKTITVRTVGVVAMTDEEFHEAMTTPGSTITLSVDALLKPGATFRVTRVPVATLDNLP